MKVIFACIEDENILQKALRNIDILELSLAIDRPSSIKEENCEVRRPIVLTDDAFYTLKQLSRKYGLSIDELIHYISVSKTLREFLENIEYTSRILSTGLEEAKAQALRAVEELRRFLRSLHEREED